MSSFTDFAAAHGLIIDRIEHDRWVRTSTTDKPHKKNGSFYHGVDFAHVRNWATMDCAVTWFANEAANYADRVVMERRMADAASLYIHEQMSRSAVAWRKAAWILSQCELNRHAYLDGKGFREELGNVWERDTGPLLVIPMRRGQDLVGAQLIDIDGGKKFLTGMRTHRAEYCIDAKGIDLWCEGYATGLSVRAAMKSSGLRYKIHICFSANNMQRMAIEAGAGFVIADNDASGAGKAAAIATGLPYWISPIAGEDANDFHRRVGALQFGFQLKKLLQ